MAQILKELYSYEYVTSLAMAVKTVHNEFDSEEFIFSVLNDSWKEEELKMRMRHISESLKHFLPADYKRSISILMKITHLFSDFTAMFFPDFVECFGLEDFETSITALELFTKYSSSEFAVRQFIIKYPDKMMKQMEKWSVSENEHVRRLSSEGCRARLPWAVALSVFKKDPAPVLLILQKLKNDKSEYVRRSVANNLNDISKDNPGVFLKTIKSWIGKNPETDWIIKHASRTLLKQGNTEVLTLFGLDKPEYISITDFEVDKSISVGKVLTFSFTITSKKKSLGKLRIEYAIHFMMKNGKQNRKVFKISESSYSEKRKDLKKTHSFKTISTRTYYSGEHKLSLIINGLELEQRSFELFK